MSTPAVQALVFAQLKQSVFALGDEARRESGKGRLLLQELAEKPSCPHTSSATVSVVNGEMYLSTRWSKKSVTYRLPAPSTAMLEPEPVSDTLNVFSGWAHSEDAEAGTRSG